MPRPRRVVFVPGIMGSVLVDRALRRDRDAAVRQCETNLGPRLSAVSRAVLIDLCRDERADVVWGKYGMAHWLFDTEAWLRRLTAGNGIDQGSSVDGGPATDILSPTRCPRRATQRTSDPLSQFLAAFDEPLEAIAAWRRQVHLFPELTSFDMNLGLVALWLYGKSLKDMEPITEDAFSIHPYDDMLNRFCAEGIDLLVFPYDWRLSNAYNATRLAAAIHARWWRRRRPEEIGPTTIPDDQKVTIVAHSMGGLLARFYIEAESANVSYITSRTVRRSRLAGYRYVRQLITIGTPHLGVPIAYTALTGARPIFEENSHLKWLREMSGRATPNMTGAPLSPSEERAVTRHCSSLIEMLPVYRFMPTESTADLLDSDRELAETYRTYAEHEPGGTRPAAKPLLHASKTPAWRMLAEFRRQLVAPRCLDQWLVQRGLTYVAAFNDDFAERKDGKNVPTTVTAYDPRTNKPALSTRGDGVVPWKSAAIYPYSDGARHLAWLPLRSGWNHHLLCQAPTTAEHCLRLIETPQPVTELPLERLSRADLQVLAEQLLGVMGYGGRAPRAVISVVRITFHEPVATRLLPFRLEGGRWQLAERHLPPGQVYCKPGDKSYICEIESKKVGRRSFAAILNAFKDPTKALIVYGGAVFLPESDCTRSLDVLTWNVGTMGDLQTSSTNDTHAELQLNKWFTSWSRDLRWKDRIEGLTIRNERLSPCSQCVGDLTKMSAELASDATRDIAWRQLYDYTRGTGPTGIREIDALEKAHWRIDCRSPQPRTY